MYLLGVDIGTTNWKANLYDYNGKLIASAKIPTKVNKDKFGDYYNPYILWKSFSQLTREILSKIKSPSSIKALSIASMAEAGLIIDKFGKPIYHIIPWYDKRTVKQKEWLEKKISKSNIFKITGLNLTYIFSALKIQWLKENVKRDFTRSSKWLCIPDFLNYKLTGEFATDYSIACRTALFDIKLKKWSKLMLDILEIKENFLPKTFPSGTVIGNITPKASEETGLTTSTRVVLGGHDHLCGSIGAGILEEGSLLDSIGTAESIVTVMHNLKCMNKIYKSGFSVGCYPYKELYYIMSGIYYSGGLIEWFIREFCNKNLDKEKIYNKLIKDAEKSKTGSNGIIVFPHWLGSTIPYRNLNSKGAILGLTPTVTKNDILNGIFEGLSFEFKQLLEVMEDTIDIKLNKIIVIGGGSKNKIWLKRKSNILGKRLIVPHINEAVSLGASLLAGIGIKDIKRPDDIIKNFNRKLIYPDKYSKKIYDNIYKIRDKILKWKVDLPS